MKKSINVYLSLHLYSNNYYIKFMKTPLILFTIPQNGAKLIQLKIFKFYRKDVCSMEGGPGKGRRRPKQSEKVHIVWAGQFCGRIR